MIYYWSPDYRTPVGGVKILYRHVDVLNSAGYQASILHRHRWFRSSWFENTTHVSYIGKTVLTAEDYLVIPENYGSLYINPSARPKAARVFNRLFATPAKKIIFNQNTYNTFAGHSFLPGDLRTIYRDERIIATLVVSENNREYLAFSFPSMRIYRIHNAINQDLFTYRAEKKPQICFMPRKNPEHAVQVINLLKHKGVVQDFTIVPIEDKSEKEAADIMQESLIFLSFGYPEGFSLPPAEAMSCGCIVIGYHGIGGREYFDPDYCFPVEMGDILEFAKAVEDVIRLYHKAPNALAQMADKASAFIRHNYSVEREREDILYSWDQLINRTRQAASLPGRLTVGATSS